jgi:predicted dehydrogenase
MQATIAANVFEKRAPEIPMSKVRIAVAGACHFAAVIRGEAEQLVTARDGLQNLRVTEAIVEAAKTGRVVDTI